MGYTSMLVFTSKYLTTCFSPPPQPSSLSITSLFAKEKKRRRLSDGENRRESHLLLYSYLRGIANVNSTESTWALDPRVEIDRALDEEGVPRGVGNHVSCEFNLLYRFHSAISDRDAKWTLDFYHQILGTNEDPKLTSLPKMLEALVKFEASISEDPSTRVFGGLLRKSDGTFNDEDLVKILKESIEDPAGMALQNAQI
jgi:hypothetical protein